MPQEKRHQHAPEAAIAIQERMQRLEFSVEDCELYQGVGRSAVDIALPRTHCLGKFVCPDRHKRGLIDRAAGRSDPVGDPAKLTWRLSLAPARRSLVPCGPRE